MITHPLRRISLFFTLAIVLLLAAGCGSDNKGNDKQSNQLGNTNSQGTNASDKNDTEKEAKTSDSKEEKKNNKALTAFVSTDGNFQVEVGKGWGEDPDLNPLAKLALSDRKKEKYALGVTYPKTQFAENVTLDNFHENITYSMEGNINNYAESDREEITINGLPAFRYTITGEVDMIKVKYLINLIETGNHFHQIVLWSSDRQYEKLEDEYIKLSDSFKVLNDEIDDSSASAFTGGDAADAELSQTFYAPDQLTSLMIPADWAVDPIAQNPDAEFIISSADRMQYLMLIKDYKEDFQDEISLTEYRELLLTLVEDVIENLEVSEYRELQINGMPAIEYEVTGVVSGMDLHYLYTIVETEDEFNQIMTWSTKSVFPDSLALFQRIAATFEHDGQ